MAASTVQLQMDRPAIGQFPPNLQYKLKINTKIPAGTWAMRVQGNDFVEPYVAGTANSILLGVAETDYDNLGGLTVKTFPNDRPMVFNRGSFNQFRSDGSITYDHVMQKVALKDNATIGMPVAANDKVVTLVAIDLRQTTGATRYLVEFQQDGP
jgi:hypothetical protein